MDEMVEMAEMVIHFNRFNHLETVEMVEMATIFIHFNRFNHF